MRVAALTSASGSRPVRRGFGTRLLVAQALVLTAGALTSWLVARAVGPGIFRSHLAKVGAGGSTTGPVHIDEAFASAMLVTLTVSLAASLLMALGVTWYLTRKVQASIAAVASSAAELAEGRHGVRVSGYGLGREFDSLAGTFNTLADQLDTVEATRRRMLADLAHEMRTPLATIEAHLEAIEDGVRDVDGPVLTVLRSSTHRLGRLAHDMSTVSRAEEGNLGIHLSTMEASHLVTTAGRAARAAFEDKGVHLLEDVGASARVRADPTRIGQVLGNLLENALRHTPAGGTVTLACRTIDDRWVELLVLDTGEGIEPKHLAHLFDRFYRADSARTAEGGGSGIGLTISRAIVELHGGGISVTSPGPGLGATFTVRIPRAPD